MNMTTSREEPYLAAQRSFDKKRFTEAFALYEDLAKAGDPRCQVLVGWMYNEGLGVKRDKEKAVNWFERAASMGSKEGAFYCGKSALAFGQYREALSWFHKAAVQEYGPALLWLGLSYVRGLGVSIDFDKGVKYLERAAATGNLPARRELALLMIRGALGFAKIPVGLVLLPYAVIAAIFSSVSMGHSDKLMG